MKNYFIKQLHVCFAVIFILTVHTTAFCQTTVIPGLPPAAQEAINKGIIAAKIPDYLLAISYFEEARKIAPQSSDIFFNLGLAESKIPGRELRAICWFGAYLTVNPEATNAAAVKEQIDILFIKNQSNLSGLIRSVQDAAGQIPYSTTTLGNMEKVSTLLTRTRKINAALKVADFSTDQFEVIRQYHKNRILANIVYCQSDFDIAGAMETTDLIINPDIKCSALCAIAEAQIKAGDISGAKTIISASLKIAELIRVDDTKTSAFENIALTQLKAVDTLSAKNTLLLAQKNNELESHAGMKYSKQSEIAEILLLTRDTASYLNALLSAQKAAELNENLRYRVIDQCKTANLQAMAGDISNAQNIVLYIQKFFNKNQDLKSESFLQESIDRSRQAIAEAQVRSGDISGAFKTVGDILTQVLKEYAYELIIGKYQIEFAKLQTKKGDISGALKMLESAKKTCDYDWSVDRKNILYDDISRAIVENVDLLLKSGDIESANKALEYAQKTTDLIKDPEMKRSMEYFIVEIQLAIISKQVKANDINGAKENLASVVKKMGIIENSPGKEIKMVEIIENLVKIHDIETAKKMYLSIMDEGRKKYAQKYLAVAYADAGDITGAQMEVDLISDHYYKILAETGIAEAQINARDIAGAKKALATAQNYLPLLKNKLYGLLVISEVQIKAGDTSGAKTNLLAARENAKLIEDVINKGYKYIQIATLQMKLDDITEAKKSLNLAILSAKLAPDTSSFNALWKDIAEAQHKAGITEMPKPIPQLALDKIASDQQKATRDEEWKKVSKWLKRLDDNGKDYTYQVGQLNTDPFLDIVGYLKSIPTSDSQKYFYELHTIADKLVAAHYMIEKKIKEIH